MKWLRRIFQLTLVLAAAVAGYRAATGAALAGIETYCPFGGLETAYSLLANQRFTCAAGELNFTLFLALLTLTLLARKAFCSWVCPVGTVNEWLFGLGRRLWPRKHRGAAGTHRRWLEPPAKVDRAARWLRLPMLGLTLFFTYKTGELIFRGYDPYYILFSWNGHDVRPWSYAVLGAILAGAVLVPMAWCRYLCPLGAALWPFAAVGRLRLKRNEASCRNCGVCDVACPHSIPVSSAAEVLSGECTLCLECVSACKFPGTLELRAGGFRR